MFPSWCDDGEGVYDLCLSDDLDSLISCMLLEKVKGYKINYFYDFSSFWQIEKSSRPAIAVDVDLTKGKCWGNHVTALSQKDSVNEQAANLNSVLKISRDNYFEKYAGNTILQIISYYGIPLPQKEEARMVLLAVDGSYRGFYSDKFRDTYLKWLEILEFDELIQLLEYKTVEDFHWIIDKYNLYKKIYMNDQGILDTEIFIDALSDVLELDLMLPWSQFEKVRDFKRKSLYLDSEDPLNKKKINKMVSCALVRRNYLCYTTY
ncbi:hypothetical protein [Desulfofundulus thermocisternus]|uniref:hypothetical protein n=1 Tax=Desulfofundulus thermocisternus TaxID=42471 RepID=UPI00217E50E8|nr:hypothetical protein [Desulfofundulus thermocisternus]